jgi:hypothetical protein
MQLYRLIYFFFVSSACFGQCFRPSSGALDCIYSIWYYSRRLLPGGVLDELRRSLNSSKTQSSAPDDGQKHRPKHVELTKKNKLTDIVASCFYLHNYITIYGFINVKLQANCL